METEKWIEIVWNISLKELIQNKFGGYERMRHGLKYILKGIDTFSAFLLRNENIHVWNISLKELILGNISFFHLFPDYRLKYILKGIDTNHGMVTLKSETEGLKYILKGIDTSCKIIFEQIYAGLKYILKGIDTKVR